MYNIYIQYIYIYIYIYICIDLILHQIKFHQKQKLQFQVCHQNYSTYDFQNKHFFIHFSLLFFIFTV